MIKLVFSNLGEIVFCFENLSSNILFPRDRNFRKKIKILNKEIKIKNNLSI
jgi:hypothetical protein